MHVDHLPALGWSLEAATCVERMNEAGIEKGVVMTIVDAPEVNPDALELIAEACAAYPGRLEAFARIHPWYGDESAELLERAFSELGFKGLKLHPVTTIAHPAGEDTLRLIRIAAAHNAPTLFHCGDEPLSTPLAIERAAEACPEATIILGHMGGYFHVDEAIEAAERRPNLVLETSAMPYPVKIREAVGRVGAARVLYASDGPACSPRIEVEKVRLARLDPDDEHLVLGANAAALLDGVL
jgi:predicted TIM-barrel fold metal-dependent hydrolase